MTHLLVKGLVLVLAFFGSLTLIAEKKEPPFVPKTHKEQFIADISTEAQSLYVKYGVLPSISISQAILESDWGTSSLATKNGNYYGIKGGGVENGSPFFTKEYLKNSDQWIEIEATFRKYDSWQESMEDHAKLLVYGTKWNPELYRSVIEAADYKEAAYALQTAGYATDPRYPEKLIRLIEQYQLDQYDHSM